MSKQIQSASKLQSTYINQSRRLVHIDEHLPESYFKKQNQELIDLNQSQHTKNYKSEQFQLQNENKLKNLSYSKVSTLKQFTLKGQQTNRSIFKKTQSKRPGSFQQIMFLKNLVSRLMRYVPSAMYARLTQFHKDIIGDLSLAKNEKVNVKYFLDIIPILKPNNYLFDIWKIVQIVIVGYHLFRCLLLVGFENDFVIEPIRVISICFFILDFILNLNAGYYSGLDIVVDRQRILKHNLMEIITSMISIFAQIYQENQIVNLIFIVRLRSLFINISIIEQNFSLNQKFPIFVTISKLLGLIILIAHTFACGFVFITKFEKEYTINWLVKQNLTNEPWEKIYLNALYFSFITMITVGYGDITPITDIEKMYVIFFTLITCIVYAYVVNTIGSLFLEFSQKSAEFKKQRYQVISYLNDRKISKPVQIGVIKYLEYTQHQEKVLKYSKVGEQFLQTIPNSLRQNVYEDFYGRIINEVSIFKKYFSKKCLSAFSQIMKEQTYGPDEKIFSQGDLDYKFFFVMSGKVELEVSLNGSYSQKRLLGYLKKGQQYGIHSLFSLESRKLTAKCLENTSILFIYKEDFIQILKEFRDDYEIYCMIKDKVSNNYEECDINCQSCQYKDHEITQCQLLQYKPRRELIINKVNYYQEQPYRDSSFVRRGLRSNFTLKHNSYIRQQLKSLRINILNKQFNNIVIKLQRKNEHLLEAIQDNGYDHDELFFNLVPEFFFYHNEIVMALDEEDFNKSSVYGSLYNQNQNLSIFNDQNIHFSKNYDVILDDQQFRQLETQQSNQANRNNKEFCQILSNQKSLQLSGINEENLSENNYVKNQNSFGESNCSIGIHGANIQTQANNSTNNHFIQNQTPILRHISQNYANQMQINLAQNTQKQCLYNLSSSNPYIPSSQAQIPEAPASPLLSYKNNNQQMIYHAQQNQINLSNHQQPVVLTQTSIKPLPPIHNLQRESSLNKMLPYSPNNYQQSNRTIQVPSQSIADGTPQNQKNLIQNINNFDNYSKIQLQKIQTENIQQENSFSMSPTKMKPIQSFDIIPNQSDSSHIQQQPQIQLQTEDQIKINYAQKEKIMQQNRKLKLKDSQKPEKMVISNNRNIDQINEYKDQYAQEDEIYNRRSKRKITAYKDFQNDDEQFQRKSRRKITVFKDNLRLSIKEKKSEFLKEGTQSIAQHLPFSESNPDNNFIEEQILEKDIFVVMEFDIIHEFQHYFPQYNYSTIKFKNKQEIIPDQLQSILQHTTNIVLKKNIKQIS
ncbi:hypothetical protein ABPG73_015872 [Tetrahymena malaccensis]